MTLIIPVGKESLSCVSEDGNDVDSGCLAGSPEDTLNKHFAKTCFLNKLEDISSVSADEDDTENIKYKSQEQCCYEYSSEESRFATLSVVDSEVVKTSTGPISTSEDKISVIKNDSDSDIEILNNSSTLVCPNSNSQDKTENLRNEGISESKLSSSTLPNFKQGHFNCSQIKSDSGYKNVNIVESRVSPERNLKLVNPANISNTINFNVYSKENETVRLRKLLQRRSVSESSSNDLEIKKQKKVRENIRHSFSSYESCDKLRNIITSDFYPNSKANLSSEYIKNATNDLLSSDKNLETLRNNVNNNNSNKIAYECRGRVSNFEIPDTLINNVKKSMIAEYQKLKKNSSLAYHQPSDSYFKVDSDSHISNNTSIENKRFSSNICETYNNDDKTDRRETVNQELPEQVQCNSKSDIRSNNGNNVINSNYCNSFQVSEANDISQSVSHSCNNNVKATSDRESSPPTRLELWKSILAEKKNSIKNQQVQKVDGIEQVERNHSEISVDCKNDFNDNEISTNNQIIQPFDDNLRVPLPDKSFPVGHLSNHESNIKPTETATVNLVILKSYDSLPGDDENKIKRKSKLAEACQGIVHALDSLPDPESKRENLYLQQNSESLCKDTKNSSSPVDRDVTLLKKDLKTKNINIIPSSIASIITTIQPPKCSEISNNEKGQQCPTPLYCSDDETFCKANNVKGNLSVSSGNESDYCQTDNCGDDCDYCSGDEAEDELDDTCDACRRSSVVSSVCKHMRVMTNGSLKSFKNQPAFNDFRHHKMASRSLNLQSVLRRSHINHQELSAIREYSVTSDEQQDSDESHDGSICDISSSWRYGLCEDQRQSCNEVKHEKNKGILTPNPKLLAKIKSNSLPASRTYSRTTPPKRPESAVLKRIFYSDDDCPGFSPPSGGVHLPPRPPRLKKNQYPILSISPPSNPTSITLPQAVSPRPTMGLQGLQQKPSYNKHSLCIQTGPKTLAPRSPLNPNPPYGFPNPPSPPVGSPGSPFQGRKSPHEAPPSPRTNSRSGALVTRNFSISDDEGGQRLSRRQVTITRHESAYKEAAEKGYLLPPSSPIDPYWFTWKLGVLIKTAEEVGSRLEESEKGRQYVGSFAQDQNLEQSICS
ncbi:hypothetical protein Avbf_08500 [Armadillidium vulgare]|nr:hypothetical protein Avbf_08500 [Armadillidium vulgare]